MSPVEIRTFLSHAAYHLAKRSLNVPIIHGATIRDWKDEHDYRAFILLETLVAKEAK